MRRTSRIAGLASLACLVIAASAQASPAPAETITMSIVPGTFPTSPPYVEQYSGTYMASGTFGDSGTMQTEFLFGAYPSPNTSTLHSVRTLTGSDGSSTLTLRCDSVTTRGGSTDQGTCAVLNATGEFSQLAGSGKYTGTFDGTTLSETLTFGG